MGSEWPLQPIGTLGKVVTGKTPSTQDAGNFGGPYPFITIPDLEPNVYVRDTARTLSEQGAELLRSCLLPPNAVMMSCIATVGKCGVTITPSFTNQQINSVICSDSIDPRYLYYCFKQLTHQLEATGGGGSVYTNVSKSRFSELRVPVPPLAEQRAIAHILGRLDDKVELNRRVNQTLEAMAQALFKSWFVDFEPFRDHGMQDSPLGEIPVGWEVKVLDDLTDFVVGGDWGKDSIQEGFTAPVQCIRGADIPDMQRGGIGKMPIRYLKRSSLETRSLQVGDIVIEISGGSPTQSTGRAVLITSQLLSRLANPLTCSNFCRLVRLSHGISPNLIYFWLRQLYDSDAFLQYETGTTGIKNFAYTIFSESHYLAVPPSETLSTFDKLVQSLLDQHANNGLESETLAAIRDALLPKLMSGEIRINDAENFVGEVT